MVKMAGNTTLQKIKTVDNQDFVDKMNKLKEKVELKMDTKKYEAIYKII